MADQVVRLIFRSVTGAARSGVQSLTGTLSRTGRQGAAAGMQVETGFERARRGTQRAASTLRQYGVQIDGQKVSINDLRQRLQSLERQRDESFDPKAIVNFNREIKDLQGNIGRMQRLDSEPVPGMGRRVAGLAASLGLGFAAVSLFRRGISRAIERGREFESGLADLEAITGITGSRLDTLGEDALRLSKQYGEAASDIIEADKLIASQLAQKIDFGTEEGFRQLQAVTEQAIILKNAAGIDLDTAVNAVSSSINQFNLEASEAERVVNTLAAGAKFGAAEVADIASAFRDSGAAAQSASVSLETNNAAIQTLAANAIRGEKAGVALRTVFLRLQTASDDLAELGLENVDLKSNGLAETLRQLTPLLDDAGALQKVFGDRAFNAASILINNADSLELLEEKVTGTNIATEQATVRMDTFEGASDRLSSTIDGALIPAFQESSGALVKLINLAASTVEVFSQVVQGVNIWFDSQRDLRNELANSETQANSFLRVMKNNRTEAAEFAAQTELTAAGEKELRDAFDEANEKIHEQTTATLEQGNALRSRRADVRNEIADLEALRREFGALGLAQQGRLNNLQTELEGLDLSIAANERVFDSLVEAMQSGEADFDTFVRNLELSAEASKKLGDNTEETGDKVTGLKGRIKEINDEIEQLLDKDEFSSEDLFKVSGLLVDKEELEADLELRRAAAEEIIAIERARGEQRKEIELSTLDIIDSASEEVHQNLLARSEARIQAVDLETSAMINAQNEQVQAVAQGAALQKQMREELGLQILDLIEVEIMYARTAKEAASGIIKGAISQFIAFQLRNLARTVKNPFLVAALAGPVVAVANRLVNALIPDFQDGGFVGGRRHRDGGTLIEAERDEFVVNRDSSLNAPRALNLINQGPAEARRVEAAVDRNTGAEFQPGGGRRFADVGGGGNDMSMIAEALSGLVVRPVISTSMLDDALARHENRKLRVGI